ncbi:DNA repair protein XRCC1 isoform X2 [Tachyglossus aculeatus]|uniref:DNA repair protein XRCC1 isoform X2 n=1 Tax=Tachyglossus aculeatus TaxID=9261 RepID=UPI0018F2B24B|nr:DNA repair protein XRCC1 isoform X2 [Tachyglossus aculeatus]
MPEIRLRHVVSCSSQDPTHSAENLLKADTYRKWRAGKAGEKQISVILQFEKEEQIHSLDIGNDGSAFVEVLAGRSAGEGEQDYEVLLVTSSFMSPSESRSHSNTNRVRLFGPDKLVRTAAEKRWDRVKLVCSQPYGKDSAYGLSFVRFHSPPDKEETEAPSPRLTKLGQFLVKEEDGGGGSLRPGALFFSRVGKTSPVPASSQPGPSYAAATLQATEPTPTPSPPPPVTKTPPSSDSNNKEPATGKRKLELSREEPSGPRKPPTPPGRPTPSAPKKARAAVPLAAVVPPVPSAAAGKASGERRGPPAKPRGGGGSGTEFGQVLAGVVVVLSGFQNPFRSELRDKALEMGAKYRPDWTADSTHLICAFANTPKYSAVLSRGGRIVRKEWVLDCHRTRRRLPCRRYLMAGPRSSSEEEEEEEEEEEDGSSEEEAPQAPRKRPQANHHAQSRPVRTSSPPGPQGPEETQSAPSAREGGTDSEGEQSDGQDNGAEDSGDTEDELRRVAELRNQKRPPEEVKNGEDPYGGSTDENTDSEETETPDLPIPQLPDFFQGKHFFLYGEFPGQERRLLVRYVTAFNGELEDYMSEKVQFVITAQDWDPSFEEALADNPSLAFVRPRWIYSCNERRKLLPHQLYGVVPQV